MCSGVYFENDVLVFPNGYAMRNKLRQNLVDKPDKSDILNICASCEISIADFP